ncbi:hypothetical protein [Bacteroides sp. An322]|uniref:hypothetical protein n=1 Tax=Bacteroides sp. An322 TaxID=1965632 RepID=UPI00194E615D|nr:hypothetical protein [Bacteroides sp. An322]
MNAIKIQIWVTLIANLLLTLMRKVLIRSWSFSGLATMVRIMLIFYRLFNHPERDWEVIQKAASEGPTPLEIFT